MSATVIHRSGVRYQNWRDRAACRDADPDLFFPPESGGWAVARAAKAICVGCPVSAECLRHAVDFPEKHGIWGGAAERERRRFERLSGEPDLCRNDLHVMDEDNTYVNPAGVRACRACRNASSRRKRAERQAAATLTASAPQPREATAA